MGAVKEHQKLYHILSKVKKSVTLQLQLIINYSSHHISNSRPYKNTKAQSPS